jgi:predicted RNA-binding Zn ribbon-like protein
MALLWADFLNSEERDYLGRGPPRDHLDDPAWVERVLGGLGARPADLRTPKARRALKALRSLLERLVRSLAEGRPPASDDLEDLNRSLGRSVRPRLVRGEGAFRLRLVPAAGGLGAVLFAVAASFAEFLEKGDPARLRLCDNPDCRWVFYDTTRSRTRRWCGGRCGSLMKVREFRRRRRGGRRS